MLSVNDMEVETVNGTLLPSISIDRSEIEAIGNAPRTGVRTGCGLGCNVVAFFGWATGATKHSIQQATSLSGEAPSFTPCQSCRLDTMMSRRGG